MSNFGPEKKREGGAKVFESKKEKKRPLVPCNSGSREKAESRAMLNCGGVARISKENASCGGLCNGRKEFEDTRDINKLSAVNQRVVRPNSGNQREGVSNFKKRFAEGSKIAAEYRSICRERIKIERQRIADAAQQRVEACNKFAEDRRAGMNAGNYLFQKKFKEDIKSDKKFVRPDALKRCTDAKKALAKEPNRDDEISSKKEKPALRSVKNEQTLDRGRAAMTSTDAKMEGPVIYEKKDEEIYKMRSGKIDELQKRELVGPNIKQCTFLLPKRSREAVTADVGRKRTKRELVEVSLSKKRRKETADVHTGFKRIKKTGGSSNEQKHENTDDKADKLLVPKSEAQPGEKMGGQNEQRSTNTYQKSTPESEEVGATGSSNEAYKSSVLLSIKQLPGPDRDKTKEDEFDEESSEESDDSVCYVSKRTILAWMVDLGEVPLNGIVNYFNEKQTTQKLEGRLLRDGILCSCCNKITSVSEFESHAGSRLHQPYENIFLEESGLCLSQHLLYAWQRQDLFARTSFWKLDTRRYNYLDVPCGICGSLYGELISCNGCISNFHQSCLGVKKPLLDDFHCTNCSCTVCGLVSKAYADGSCSFYSPLLSCYQCEDKYHQECIPEEDVIDSGSNKSPYTFCGKTCQQVFQHLQKLLGVEHELGDGYSWRLIRRVDEDSHLPLYRRSECNAKLAVALTIMDECFMPMTEDKSKINLIPSIVYNCGSNYHRANFNGFYTFTLERGDEVICVASARFIGNRLAEIPLFGTRKMYRRHGMCRLLASGIKSVFGSLGIRKLVVPATPSTVDIWSAGFGFEPLIISKDEAKPFMNVFAPPGSIMLQKQLLKKSYSQPTDEAKRRNLEAEAPQFTCGEPNPCASKVTLSLDQPVLH